MRSHVESAKDELKRIRNEANDRVKQITDGANAWLRRMEGTITDAVKEANDVANDEAVKHK
jgi:hypothetical protein